ncbi:MAG: polysaccharide biosynthesis tyrosine autokinase [Sedimentisphaerales bacterium]|nr:polysaccharide biosynthesis tyrosine autokinase [Sedimentisphaerales bacterium]
MNDLEKYLDRVIGQKSPDIDMPASRGGLMQIPMLPESDSDTDPTLNIGGALLRRWYIILLVFLLFSAVGVPAIWLLIQREYVVTSAIRVDPIIENIITGNLERTSNYASFMTTQAMMVTSPQVVEKVAGDLSNKGLRFFEERTNTLSAKVARRLGRREIKPDLANVLKQAVRDGTIIAGPLKRGEHIMVSMTWSDPAEAKRIVDSFVRNYMAVEVTSTAEGEERALALLEDEQKVLSSKMDSYMAQISSMAEEFGSKKLVGRYDMKLQRVGKLLAVLTEVESKRIYLQAQVKLMEETGGEQTDPKEWVSLRENYVNKDPSVSARNMNIIALEQDLVLAKQELATGNPKIKQKEDLLAAMKISIEEQKEKTRAVFNELMEKETASADVKKLSDIKAELDQTQAHEDEIRELLAQEDAETIDLGQKNLALQDLQEQFALNKELYDKISRRIQEFKMERKRPARISLSYKAEVQDTLDKRGKYTAVLVFGSLACGALLAFLREKADRSLRTPDDVTRRIGLRIIGTTASTSTVKPAHLTEQVAGDYQTIRANLGLIEGNSNNGMAKNLVVTSPGMQEGKTTFAANLAISTSRSGKKVLLIDGDLRNPHISSLLGLPKGLRGLQDVLKGKSVREAVYSANGFDVLASDSSNIADAFELLASSVTPQRFNEIGRDYDHVIIDTPPVLAFADALIWAKIADGVILTCFAGQTTGPNLNKAKERLAQANANVLGTVLSNVELDDSYHPYGYHYYPRGGRSKSKTKRVRNKMLLPMNTPSSDADNS